MSGVGYQLSVHKVTDRKSKSSFWFGLCSTVASTRRQTDGQWRSGLKFSLRLSIFGKDEDSGVGIGGQFLRRTVSLYYTNSTAKLASSGA